jgi:MHS family alpha-ketoglutarate permease-like MFS transporter
MPPAPDGPAPARRLRSIVGGSAGNLVEWYDWYAYSAFSLYFARAVFPPGDRTAQLLNAAAVFAVGFLVRPLGAWLLGWYADRRGRRAALTLSVLLMGGGSLMVAVTPPYAAAGLLAPALLVAARLVQGLSVGGEYGASATYLSEMAGARHRGFWSSFQYVTLIAGQLLALGVVLALPAPARPGGALGVGVARARSCWARRPRSRCARCGAASTRPRRSPAARPPRRPRSPLASLRALRAHPRAVATVVGLTAGRHGDVLHVHDLRAEVPRQHRGARRGRGHAGERLSLALFAACSRSWGPCPTASGAARCSSPSACSAPCARCRC